MDLINRSARVKRLPSVLRRIGVAVALSFGLAASAGAANINSFIINGPNQASDEDREYLIKGAGNGGDPQGKVSVGDSLRGLINFNTINSGAANLGGNTPNDEFTGVFQVKVLTAVPNPINPSDLLVTFGADPAFAATLAALGIPVVGGEIAALFNDSTKNFCADFNDPAPCVSPVANDDGAPGHPPSSADVSNNALKASEEAFIGTATDGSPANFWATIGLKGLAGEGIVGDGPANILTAFGLTSGSSAGNVNAALNLISIGPAFGSFTINRITPSPFGGTVDFALSQQLRGISDLDTPFEVSTNTNVSFNARVVPEPSSLLLLGGALAALGMRRRNKKA